MRIVLGLLCLLAALGAQAQLSDETVARLCQAATQESALGVKVDNLIESGELAMQSGESLLSLSCGQGETLLSRVIKARQAENLEYAVIDMGLTLKQSRVELKGQTLTLGQALAKVGQDSDKATRAFVNDYLDVLADEQFNPNLRVSLK